ncbi:MAG: hypothetical protein WC823_04060 [Parcubacteria group bacterium]|jgi:hypothetical protein
MHEKTLQELADEMAGKNGQIEQATSQTGKIAADMNATWRLIRERILAGESYGNPISDYVIVKYGELRQEVVDKLNTAQQRFSDCLGQYFMMIQSKPYRWKYSSNGDGDFCDKDELIVGVVVGDFFEFDLSKRNFIFPEKCNRCITLYSGELELHEKHAVEMLTNYSSGCVDDMGLQIIIGNDEVLVHIRRLGLVPQFCEGSVFLGKSLDAYPVFRDCLAKMRNNEIRELYRLMTKLTWMKVELISSKVDAHEFKENEKRVVRIREMIAAVISRLESLGVDVSHNLRPLMGKKAALESRMAFLVIGTLDHAECFKELEVIDEALFNFLPIA